MTMAMVVIRIMTVAVVVMIVVGLIFVVVKCVVCLVMQCFLPSVCTNRVTESTGRRLHTVHTPVEGAWFRQKRPALNASWTTFPRHSATLSSPEALAHLSQPSATLNSTQHLS